MSYQVLWSNLSALGKRIQLVLVKCDVILDISMGLDKM